MPTTSEWVALAIAVVLLAVGGMSWQAEKRAMQAHDELAREASRAEIRRKIRLEIEELSHGNAAETGSSHHHG